MKEKFSKLIDLKSIITMSAVFTLEFLLIFLTLKTGDINNVIFTVFASLLSAITTYYFTKKKDESKSNTEGDNTK